MKVNLILILRCLVRFFEAPVRCLELVSGEDLLKDYKMMKQNGLEKIIL